jgi:tetratricopeptide (TPR) repeat protein
MSRSGQDVTSRPAGGRDATTVLGRLVTLAIMVLVVAVAAPARADEELPRPTDPGALKFYVAGNEAYTRAQATKDPVVQRREYDLAIQNYRAGVALEHTNLVSFYWNLAHSYRQIGQFTKATWFYRKFLEFAPASLYLHRDAAQNFINQMRADLDREHALEGPTDPTPTSPAAASPLTVTAQENHRSAPWYRDRLGWTLASGGVVGVLVGGGFLWSGASLYDQAAGETRAALIADLESRGQRRVVIGAVSGGIGVVVLAVGVIRLASTPASASRPSPIQVTVGPTGFVIGGSF